MAAELAGGGARRAAAAVGVLLDRRDRDDGDQPIPVEASGDAGPALGRARRRAAQAHRPPARRHSHRQHAGDRGGELAFELHRDQAVRRGQDRLRRRHAGDLVPDHHLLGDHAEGHRRNLPGAHRASPFVPAQGDAAPSRARRLVRKPVREAAAVAVADPDRSEPGYAQAVSRGDPYAGARVFQLHAEKASVDPAQPVRCRRGNGAGHHGAARAHRGYQSQRRHGDHLPPARHQLPHAAARVPRRARRGGRRASPTQGAGPAAHRRARQAGAGSAARRALLRALDHAGAGAAAVLPGKQGARRAGGRRVRRADGPGHARGHHRGDHRQVHHLAALGGADPRLGRAGHRHRRGHDAGARHQPGAGPQSADRRTEDPQRADRRVPAGHSRGRRFRQDRQRADGNRACPGPDGENSAYLPAGRAGRKRRGLRGLERVFQPLQTSSRGALSAPQPEGLAHMATAVAAIKGPKEFLFLWEGKDRGGKIIRGELRAVSETAVNATLRRQGILVQKVKRQKIRSGGRVSEKDLALFTRQLATMMKAGVPLLQSFDIVGKGASNPAVQKLLLEIKTEVETGSSLAAAFRKYPLYFDALYCNLVQAGEQAGILESLLERLASYKEKILAIKSKIKSALFYPIAIIAVAFIITAVIMIFVIPAFKEVFRSFGADLPAPTLIVMAISDWFVSKWYIIFPVIIGGIYGFLEAWKRSLGVQIFMDRLMLRMPVFGDLVRKSTIARWTRSAAHPATISISWPPSRSRPRSRPAPRSRWRCRTPTCSPRWCSRCARSARKRARWTGCSARSPISTRPKWTMQSRRCPRSWSR